MKITRRNLVKLPAAAALTQAAIPAALKIPELGYRPSGMSMWDTWHIEHKGRAHMIHLQRLAAGSCRTVLEGDTLGHAVSDDLIHWTEVNLALGPGSDAIDDMQPWTGCVVPHAGRFYLFYTMRGKKAGGAQRIGLATSTDLLRWERHAGNPVIEPDPKWYVSIGKPDPGGVVDCRDLVVIPDPAGKGWLGFYAARTPDAKLAEGSVIAAVRSRDLLRWEHLPPAFAPRRYACMEVPDVFEIGGKWYMMCLTGHEYGNRGIYRDPNVSRGTIYAVADRAEGPYREFPDDNVLLGSDSTTGYSCRSFVFQGERHVFYTETIPGGAALLSPPARLKTDAPGHLRLAYSPRTAGWRKATLIRRDAALPTPRIVPSHYRWTMPAGTWRIEGRSYLGEAENGFQLADIGVKSLCAEIEATVRIERGAAAGFAWGAAPGGRSRDLVFMLDAEAGCVRASRRPWFNDPWARQFPVERGRAYHVRISARPPRFDIFVDDVLVLQFAVPAPPPEPVEASVCLFVDRGAARISDLAVYRLGSA